MREPESVTIPALSARPEAAPLAWERLTDQQRVAAARVWALLRSMLNSPTTLSRYQRDERGQLDRVLPAIAPERHSLTVMIDGERGSGKTALLVSLLDRWNRAARKPSAHWASSEMLEVARSYDDLCDPRGRVIPIGLLDLRSLPPTTSLTMHVASLLHELVRLSEVQGSTLSDPLSPSATKVAPALRSWQRFVQAAAALELRFQDRGEHMDPETFAIELSDTEQDRLDLNERFCTLVDALVSLFAQIRPDGGAPLFVIAIDDADMNPTRAFETFGLLERFRHPRLAFLLTGDSSSFGPILRSRLLADFRASLRGIPTRDVELDRLKDLRHTEKLAQQLYDKVIPPSHHCPIPAISPSSRLAAMSEALERVPLSHPCFPTVAAYFRQLPELARALPSTMRELTDLRIQLPGFDMAGLAQVCWNKAVEEEPGPAGEILRERYQSWVNDGYDLDVSEGRVFEDDMLTVGLKWRDVHTFRFNYNDVVDFKAMRGFVATVDSTERRATRSQESLLGRSNKPPTDKELPPLELSSRATYAYLLTVEAHALVAQDTRSDARREYPGWDHQLARASIVSLTHVRGAEPWPIPHWKTYAVLRAVSRHWTSYVSALPGYEPKQTIERAALGLIHVIVAIYQDIEHPEIPPLLGGREDWLRAFERAYVSMPEVPSDNEFDRAYIEWVRTQLLHFSTPDSGLESDARAHAVAAFEAHSKDGYRDFVDWTYQRRKYLGRVGRHDYHSSLSELRDEARSEHHLFPKYYQAATERFLSAMRDIPVEVDSWVHGPWIPKFLLGYLPDPVWKSGQLHVDIYSIDRLAATIRDVTKPGLDACALVDRCVLNLGKELQDHTVWLRLERPRFGFEIGNRDGRNNFGYVDHDNDANFLSANDERFKYAKNAAALQWHTHQAAGLDLLLQYLMVCLMADDREDAVLATQGDGWPCFRVREVGEKETSTPWPYPAWQAPIDQVLSIAGWNQIRKSSESPDALARAYVDQQLRIFANRQFAENDEERAEWYELVSRCASTANTFQVHRSFRAKNFVAWVQKLFHLAAPSALLPPASAAAVLVACRDHGLLDETEFRLDPEQRKQFAERFPTHPWTRIVRAKTADPSIDAEIDRLRAEFSLPSSSN